MTVADAIEQKLAAQIMPGNGPHEDIIGLIVKEHRWHSRQAVKLMARHAESINSIGPLLQVLIISHFKKITQRKPKIREFLMKIDEYDQRPDFRRITQPFILVKIE